MSERAEEFEEAADVLFELLSSPRRTDEPMGDAEVVDMMRKGQQFDRAAHSFMNNHVDGPKVLVAALGTFAAGLLGQLEEATGVDRHTLLRNLVAGLSTSPLTPDEWSEVRRRLRTGE